MVHAHSRTVKRADDGAPVEEVGKGRCPSMRDSVTQAADEVPRRRAVTVRASDARIDRLPRHGRGAARGRRGAPPTRGRLAVPCGTCHRVDRDRPASHGGHQRNSAASSPAPCRRRQTTPLRARRRRTAAPRRCSRAGASPVSTSDGSHMTTNASGRTRRRHVAPALYRSPRASLPTQKRSPANDQRRRPTGVADMGLHHERADDDRADQPACVTSPDQPRLRAGTA